MKTGGCISVISRLASELGIHPTLLVRLGDVDRPEDLRLWSKFQPCLD
jgi:glycosyltransferase A (GT-A) superfamily protein (DUF2064 family)